jgi:hypothetical protein
MFIGITGNAYTLAEDLVRRTIVTELDANVENPELRRFAGDFLADIAQQRSQLLQAALIIWRYGRQQVRSNRPPLGGFETWSRWCRDPLVALRCRDPVAEIAKSKTTDPNRRQTVEIFQTWWEQHADGWVTINDLDLYVKLLLVPDPKKRNRQSVEHRVRKLVGTRLAGFHLTSDADDENKGYWSATKYRLEQVGQDESEPATAAAEAAAGSQGDDPDDFYFNREGDDAAAQPAAAAAPQDAKDSSPSEQAKTAAKTNGGQRAPGPAQQPLPSDPVERWRTCFARLDPRRDPCPGLRLGDWARIHAVGKNFLAGPLAKLAADAGWSDLDLFGVDPKVGIARLDACGALMASRGTQITQVTPQLVRYATGLAIYRARLNVGGSVPVWDWKDTGGDGAAR